MLHQHDLISKSNNARWIEIKLEHLIREDLDTVLRAIKKVASLDEICPEASKTKKLDDIFLWLCNTI